MSTREVVLPSGRFATIRPITWLDRAVSRDENPEFWIFRLALRVVEIDGAPLEFAEAAGMLIAEAQPIINVIAAELTVAAKSNGVS